MVRIPAMGSPLGPALTPLPGCEALKKSLPLSGPYQNCKGLSHRFSEGPSRAGVLGWIIGSQLWPPLKPSPKKPGRPISSLQGWPLPTLLSLPGTPFPPRQVPSFTPRAFLAHHSKVTSDGKLFRVTSPPCKTNLPLGSAGPERTPCMRRMHSDTLICVQVLVAF